METPSQWLFSWNSALRRYCAPGPGGVVWGYCVNGSLETFGGYWQTLSLIGFTFCCCSGNKWCLTLCNSMNCSTSGFSVLHYLPEFAQTHVHSVSDVIQLKCPSSVPPSLSCPQSLPASGSFPMSQLFASGGQSIGALASASVLPVKFRVGFL